MMAVTIAVHVVVIRPLFFRPPHGAAKIQAAHRNGLMRGTMKACWLATPIFERGQCRWASGGDVADGGVILQGVRTVTGTGKGIVPSDGHRQRHRVLGKHDNPPSPSQYHEHPAPRHTAVLAHLRTVRQRPLRNSRRSLTNTLVMLVFTVGNRQRGHDHRASVIVSLIDVVVHATVIATELQMAFRLGGDDNQTAMTILVPMVMLMSRRRSR